MYYNVTIHPMTRKAALVLLLFKDIEITMKLFMQDNVAMVSQHENSIFYAKCNKVVVKIDSLRGNVAIKVTFFKET